MRSSTFSSRITAEAAFAALIVALLVYGVCLEAAARVVVPKLSEGLRRQGQDYRTAIALRQHDRSGRRTVLLVGNSLLLEGVDRAALVAKTPEIDVNLFPMVGTSYFDWYYGLNRYFAEGAQPAVIGLCINARQLLFNSTNGESFAHYMLQTRDFKSVFDSTTLDTMTASNYFFAHWSQWLANRSNARVGLLERLLPDSRILAPHLSHVTGDGGGDDLDASRMVERLQRFRDFTEAHGAKFIWIVPPTLNASDPAPRVQVLGRSQGVRVLVPVDPGTMPKEFFADGFHLNSEGARVFSERLASQLSQAAQQP
jgi:hypothetical protein